MMFFQYTSTFRNDFWKKKKNEKSSEKLFLLPKKKKLNHVSVEGKNNGLQSIVKKKILFRCMYWRG